VRAEGQLIRLTGTGVAGHPAGRRMVFVQEPERSDETFYAVLPRMPEPKR